jgi:hypothetical protein
MAYMDSDSFLMDIDPLLNVFLVDFLIDGKRLADDGYVL